MIERLFWGQKPVEARGGYEENWSRERETGPPLKEERERRGRKRRGVVEWASAGEGGAWAIV